MRDLERIGKKVGAPSTKISLQGITTREFLNQLWTWITENPLLQLLDQTLLNPDASLSIQTVRQPWSDRPNVSAIIIIVENPW